MSYAHGYQKKGSYNNQTPVEDPHYDAALEAFLSDAEAGGDEWMEQLYEDRIVEAFRLIWKAWATKKTRVTNDGVLFDFATNDKLVQQFDGLLQSAKNQFDATYEPTDYEPDFGDDDD